MKDQRVLKTETMVSSCMKETYVAPKTMSYSVQNEGVLCSSNPTGTVNDPTYGVSAGFDNIETTSLWD